jgi:hypothetical protein
VGLLGRTGGWRRSGSGSGWRDIAFSSDHGIGEGPGEFSGSERIFGIDLVAGGEDTVKSGTGEVLAQSAIRRVRRRRINGGGGLRLLIRHVGSFRL